MNLLCTTVSWIAVVKSGFFSLTASTFGYGWTVGYDIHITSPCPHDTHATTTTEPSNKPHFLPDIHSSQVATCPLLRSYFSGTFDPELLVAFSVYGNSEGNDISAKRR